MINGLERNAHNDNKGLKYQFRVSTKADDGSHSQARHVNGSTVKLNGNGQFPAVKNTRVSYDTSDTNNTRATTLSFVPSLVSEVTHYEIGIRLGKDSIGFTGAELTMIQAAVDGKEGFSVVSGKIRVDESVLEVVNGRVSATLNLATGTRVTLAIRAVVVENDVVIRESANANRSINVRS